MAKIEEEVTLLIKSDKPWKTAKTIAKLDKIGDFSLLVRPDISLRDTYYDTFYGAVGSAKSSLRIRRIYDNKKEVKTLVTVKGGNFSSGAAKKHVEHEFEWNIDGVTPEKVFNLFELAPIQIRDNHRQVRDVYAPGEKDAFAELVIDDLLYRFKNQNARLFELEIETKAGSDDADIHDVAACLRKQFPILQNWKHSKLTMGKLLEAALDIKIGDHNVLTSKSFDAITAIL